MNNGVMKSRNMNSRTVTRAGCIGAGCTGCKRCTAVNGENAWTARNEWKSSTQLYGAEAHSYYYYFLLLYNSVNSLKNETV
jgi:hypothetical protein